MNRRQFLKVAPLTAGVIVIPRLKARSSPGLALCGAIMIGVGVVIVIELYQLCKKLFPPPPKPPPPPPEPCNCGMPGCTCPKANAASQPPITLKLTDDNINFFDISNLGYVDPKTGAPILAWFSVKVMKSYDCITWSSRVQIQGWYSQSGITLQFDSPGFPSPWTMATYLPLQGTIEVPVDLGSVTDPAGFFKLL